MVMDALQVSIKGYAHENYQKHNKYGRNSSLLTEEISVIEWF